MSKLIPFPDKRMSAPELLKPGRKPVGDVEASHHLGEVAFYYLGGYESSKGALLLHNEAEVRLDRGQKCFYGYPVSGEVLTDTDYAEIGTPDLANSLVGEQPTTFIAKAYYDSTATDAMNMISAGDRGNGVRFNFQFRANGRVYFERRTDNWAQFYWNTTLADDEYHTFVLVYDGVSIGNSGADSLRLFVDGIDYGLSYVESGSITPSTFPESQRPIYLGILAAQSTSVPPNIYGEEIRLSFAAAIKADLAVIGKELSLNPYQFLVPKTPAFFPVPVTDFKEEEIVTPDEKMWMPELYKPGRKPVGDVEIDWSHSLGKLVSSYILGGRDLVDNTPSELPDGTITWKRLLTSPEQALYDANIYQFLRPKTAIKHIYSGYADNEALYLTDKMMQPEMLKPGRKPFGEVEIDWSHWSSKGLVLYFGHFTRLRELANNLDFVVNGDTRSTLRNGIYCDGDQDFIAFDNSLFQLINWTVCFTFTPLALDVAQELITSGDQNLKIRLDASNVLRLEIFDYSWRSAVGTTVIEVGATYWIQAVCSADNEITLYLNGTLEASANINDSPTLSNDFFIGMHSGGSANDYNGYIDSIAIYDRVIHKSLTEAPYQFLKPKSAPKFLPPSDQGIFIPDIRAERPEMYKPGRKPTGPVEIDWEHPLSEGLYDYWLITEYTPTKDLTKRRTFGELVNTPTWGVDNGGKHYETIASNSEIARLSDAEGVCNGDDEFTFFIRAKISSSNTGNYTCFGEFKSDNNNKLFCLRNEGAIFGFGMRRSGDSGSLSYAELSENPNDDKIHNIVFGLKGTTQFICIDGGDYNTFDASSKISTYSNAVISDRLSLGVMDRSSPAEYSDIKVYLAGRYERGLSETEAIALSKNPYQFLTPK